ncbi:hypothetical protein [Spiroplasma chrysopicola]|uniref:Transmembrane protein n=1 Tax=Spiroplasma chrysopicola DF-1 TaxID=1276227 RepID=R4UFE8_9MOLU|nr:hypothetical protein [Spiroplasma chrysopicola]AGM24870.1 hypothetical protein SCHRY_v1c02850 [Spiroplasma chrysopicola DF-1]
MKQKPTYGSDFPDLELINTASERKKIEDEMAQLAPEEEKRFKFVSPIQHNDFSQRKMYWSSPLEKVGRAFIIIAQLLAITLAYFIGQKVIVLVLGGMINPDIKVFGTIYVRDLLTFGFLFITLVFGLLYFIPMAIVRTAGGIYGWAITYIVLAILYFFFIEIICAVLLILGSIKQISGLESISIWLFVFMAVVLAITSLWIVGACLLIVKSDDIKRKISLEV